MCVCVCVCVCVHVHVCVCACDRERERERETDRQTDRQRQRQRQGGMGWLTRSWLPVHCRGQALTTVFNFTQPLGEKIVFRLPSIIPYIACQQNFSCRFCKLAKPKDFVFLKYGSSSHNTYCVKCSLSYTADYTGTCPKSPVIFWLIRR